MDSSTDYSHNNHGWQQVVYRKRHQKQKPADQTASGGKMVGNKTLTNGSYNVFSALMVTSEAEETEKAMASLSGAAAKIDPSHLATSLAEYNVSECNVKLGKDNTHKVSFQFLSLFVNRLCRNLNYGGLTFTLRTHFRKYHYNG